jgi:alanine racemase/UDP-N-acetylmuramoyl-tripeptide--D-alanyl-D-alanine ligase
MDTFDLHNWPGFANAGGDLSTPVLIDQIAIDSRRIHSNQSLFVALKGDKLDGHQFVKNAAEAGAKLAIVSNQWTPPSNLPAILLLKVPNPLAALQEIAKCYRTQLPAKIIGITGSFGKTMVKDLLYRLLSTKYCTAASPESFNSQIGVPLSLLTLQSTHQFAVIEAAISKKQEIDTLADLISPDYTILTPIGKKHLATLDDIPTLKQEMTKFIHATSPAGWSLIPSDTDYKSISFPIYFWDAPQPNLPHAAALNSKESATTTYLLTFPDLTTFQGEIIAGYSYFLNLLNMAIKAAWLLGIGSASICQVLESFLPEPMHTEIWKSPKGTIFVNEPYCSDPQSIDKALTHFDFAGQDQRKIFVFGGMRSDPSLACPAFRRIGHALANKGLHHLILYGPHSYRSLIDEMKIGSKDTLISSMESQNEAFSYLSEFIQPQDYVVIKGENKIPLDNLTELFHDSLSNNQCMINLAAIQTNINLIRKKLAPETRLMIIVKALAYGTDDVRLAKFLSNCGIDILGVSYVDEGIALKRAGVTQSIFALNAAVFESAKVVKWQLEVGVSSFDFVHALAKEAKIQQKQIKVHLHIDTGMGRFGCRPEEACELALLIKSYPELILEGLMTHFPCAEDPHEDSFTLKQIALFDQVIDQIKNKGIDFKWKHAANSSAAMRFDLPQYNMARIGLAAYGLYLSEAVKEALDLRLALSLTSRIVGINICNKGETISYGKSYHIEKDKQKIAVLPIGYFDGLHRKFSGKSHVIIRGKKAPMVGNICMDYMMVDISEIPDAAVGDKVLIFGQDEYGHYLSPEELAISGNSIIHELITCLGPRIQRIFVDEESYQIR